jgi:hypothetical protein
MGTNSTYFSNQGEPTRTNPLTPELNQVALVKLQDTTQSTDKIGSSYFVEENYDDFIMAKDPPTLTSMVP